VVISQLELINKEMKVWVQMDVWDRLVKKNSMAKAIAGHHRRIEEMWRTFQTALQMQNLAAVTRVYDVADSQKSILENIESTTNSWRQELAVAQEADKTQYKMLLINTTSTITSVQDGNGAREVQVDNLGDQVKELKDLVAQLKLQNSSSSNFSESDPEDDPELKDARARLIRALEGYKGEHPPMGIDHSELTIPVEMHRGDHATIYKGVRAGNAVAIKRVNMMDSELVAVVYKRINRESKIWEKLNHPNVVSFLGCSGPKNEIPYMISEWMPNGNARLYARKLRELKNFGRGNDADCVKICLDVAEGLVYLHSQAIIHGGLKASNILIDGNYRARITDFALASIAAEVQTGSRPPPMRWSAPEVLEGELKEPGADIYSFACTILEIITDADPFQGHTHLYRLHRLIREGLRPDFPESAMAWDRGLTNNTCPLWARMEASWAPRANRRPVAGEVRNRMREIWKSRGGAPYWE